MQQLLTAIVIALSASVALAGCARKQAEGNPCPESGARIFVASDGAITLNGGEVAIDALHDALLALSPAPTVVCHSRDNAAGEPPPVATQVVDVIIQLQLPVAFYTDDTFDTVVEMQ